MTPFNSRSPYAAEKLYAYWITDLKEGIVKAHTWFRDNYK